MPDKTQTKPDGNAKEKKNDCPWKFKKRKILSGVKVWAGILET